MTLRPSVAMVGIAAALVLTVAACSSGATQTPGAAASPSAAAASMPSIAIPSALASALASAGKVPDVGTLLTADMAASIIGGNPAKVSPPINVPGMSIAAYRNDSGDSVTVFVQAVPGGVATAQLQAAIAMAGAQGQLQPVSGVGDAAGKVVNANDATVAFVKGSTLAVIEATSGTSAGTDLEPKLEALAQQVASKL